MRLACGPQKFSLSDDDATLRVILYGQAQGEGQGSAGEAVRKVIFRENFECPDKAWDFLSIALSIITADIARLRKQSPDGWTRDFEVHIAVTDIEFWKQQAESLEGALKFLTTDCWTLQFYKGGIEPLRPNKPIRPKEDSVVLLSGGLDSLVGAIDLAASEYGPLAVSHIVRGDADKQKKFAASIGNGLRHIQLNHVAKTPGGNEKSQRSRSLIFLAYGILVATALERYHEGDQVNLFLCENGFISLNPPLTGGRLGSLSTRTAHPEFLQQIQRILDAGQLRVKVVNPYLTKTKGEMLRECKNQPLLESLAIMSTSCSRFQRFKNRHCGRCFPCQVRRAALLEWKSIPDRTVYKYEDLGGNDSDHSRFDDVRSVAVALAEIKETGIEQWLRKAPLSQLIGDWQNSAEMLQRGMAELERLHKHYGVK